MGQRVLIVEDDIETADFLAKALRQDGFTVEHVADGRDGLIMGSDSSFDLIVMDRMLPTLDGLSVVRALRAAGIGTPILILSAVSHIDERVKGLRAGGDDYITKPFGYSEVAARIDNLLRRRPGKEVETELSCGDLRVDLLSRRATRGGQAIDLLPREFKLLEYLLRRKDHVVTRTMLLEQVWDYRFDPHTSVIDTHVSRLRKKIDDGFATPLLHTIRGAGYRLSERP
jgi:two-component system OmpR family response regulator